jgi:cation:H+ antiporter
MDLLLWFLVLAAALAVLIKGADIFVEKAAHVARVLGISDLIIGVTLVALGTSLPELAASLSAVFNNAGEFVAGTVVGSNLANITFILGAAALAFRGVSVSSQMMASDLPIMMASALILTVMAMDGSLGRLEGAALLSMYLVFTVSIVRRQREQSKPDRTEKLKWTVAVWLVASGAAIYLGAEYTVQAAVKITELLGLNDTSRLALTVVAVGSSLPELVVTLTAAKKGFDDLSVGNVVGSNICNTFLVAGAPALITPLPVSPSVVSTGLPFMLAASLLLWFFVQKEMLSRQVGVIFLLVFVVYLARLCGVQ